MIKTIKELSNYLHKQEREIAEEVGDVLCQDNLMTTPGLGKEEELRIKEVLPTLPESYWDMVRQYSINGIHVGYVALSPFSNDSLYESLIEAKKCEYFQDNFMKANDFIIIGGQNEDVTCVTGTKSKTYTPGEIVLILNAFENDYPEESQLHPLAKSFEDFAILSGNVNQILNYQREINDDSTEKYVEEFTKVLKELNINKKYWENWIGPRIFAGH